MQDQVPEQVSEHQQAVAIANFSLGIQQIANTNMETVHETNNISLQQRMQDLQRIQELQRDQRAQFLERLEQQKQQQHNDAFYNHKRTHEIQQPEFSKTKLINSTSNNELRTVLGDFNKFVTLSLDKIEKIDIDEFKQNLDIVFDTITKYNQDIASWNDDKFYSDKNKFYDSIKQSDNIFFNYEKSDFICIPKLFNCN